MCLQPMGWPYLHCMLELWVKPHFNAIPHVLVVVHYLHVLVWLAIWSNVKFFRLVFQVAMMVHPIPPSPLLPFSNLDVDIKFGSFQTFFCWGSQVSMHSYVPIYCFEARVAIGFQIPFKLHCARLEQCCYMASFYIFLLLVSSFTYLGGRLGIGRLRFGYKGFILAIGKKFKWNICCAHRP